MKFRKEKKEREQKAQEKKKGKKKEEKIRSFNLYYGNRVIKKTLK